MNFANVQMLTGFKNSEANVNKNNTLNLADQINTYLTSGEENGSYKNSRDFKINKDVDSKYGDTTKRIDSVVHTIVIKDSNGVDVTSSVLTDMKFKTAQVGTYTAEITYAKGTISTPVGESETYKTSEVEYSGTANTLIVEKKTMVINVLDPYEVIFYENAPDSNSDVAFRTYVDYNRSSTPSGKFKLKKGNVITAFYDIPAFAEDEYVFKGWYYDKENEADDNPVDFANDTFDRATNVYAHWIEVGKVDKDDSDEKEIALTDGKYKGFDLVGAQVRESGLYDDNIRDGDGKATETPAGLRFVTSLSNNLLKEIDKLSSKTVGENNNKVEYGYAVARKQVVNDWLAECRERLGEMPESFPASYKLRYNGNNVNGVNTAESTKVSEHFSYVTNVDCTANDYSSRTEADHFKNSDYRLYTLVITYDDQELDEIELTSEKNAEIIARSYIRYYDANGLLRTFYNDYSGTNTFGGCCTNYSNARSYVNNFKERSEG